MNTGLTTIPGLMESTAMTQVMWSFPVGNRWTALTNEGVLKTYHISHMVTVVASNVDWKPTGTSTLNAVEIDPETNFYVIGTFGTDLNTTVDLSTLRQLEATA